MKKIYTTVLLAASLLMATTATAQEQADYKGLPTGDSWVRSDKKDMKMGTTENMQMQTYGEGITSYGVMSFEFTAPAEGQKVKTAVLRTMTRVFNGGDRALKIYALPEYVDADNATWDGLGDKLTTALASEPVAAITIVGQLGKNISKPELYGSMQTVAAWQNTIDLSDYVKTLSTNKFSILIAKVTDENKNSQFFTKEAAAMKWDDTINDGAAISVDDIRPLLTVTYQSTTGIKEVNTTAASDNVYHNLQGVRVDHPVKGVYIVNGKKVVVK